jgi:hypothetical protein
MVQYPVAAGQTFTPGDFVLLVESGTIGLTIAATAGNNFTQATTNSTRVLGRATTFAVDSTLNTLNTSASVIIADDNVEFLAPLYSATPASAVPTITQIGTSYGMRQVAGGYPAVNIDDTTNVFARITDFDPNDFAGWPAYSGAGTTQYANVWFKIIGASALLAQGR